MTFFSLVLLGALPTAQAQEVDFDVSGAVEVSTRYQIEEVTTGPFYNETVLPQGFIRNQNTWTFGAVAKSGSARGVADVDLVLTGMPASNLSLDDLSDRTAVDPLRLEVHSMYLQAWDVGLPGMDLRIGQQLVQWGVGDQFNPTNNLNADDLEDPLLFGDQLGNIMARADYSPRGNMTLSGVVVPIFKPALLPSTSFVGLSAVDRIPVADDALRWRLHSDRAAAQDFMRYPTVVNDAVAKLPEANVHNMQWAVQLGGSIGMQDIALSYYKGRTDFPQATSNHTTQQIGEFCAPGADPADEDAECYDGLLLTDVTLGYPRMEVWGLNAAGEVNPLGFVSDRIQPIGYRVEFALIDPAQSTIELTNDTLDFGLLTQEAGEYDYGLSGDDQPIVVEDAVFAKWTVGLDYSFGRHLYVNAQWVHGMPDEYGAGDWAFSDPDGQRRWMVREAGVTSDAIDSVICTNEQNGEACAREVLRSPIGDYAVIGADLRFGATLLRVFTITDLTPLVVEEWDAEQGKRISTTHNWRSDLARSRVLYPELQYNFGNGMELSGGALFLMGSGATKFGDPAAGGNLVFAKGKYSF